MRIEELVKKLNLPTDGKYTENSYTITLNDDIAFTRLFNKLDSNPDIEAVDENTVTALSCNIAYTYENYLILLDADFLTDEYTIKILEPQEE